MSEQLIGNLIIIGGAEDKENRKDILKKVCSYIDCNNDLLVIATAATEYPKEVACKYKKVFTSLNVKNIAVLDITSRKDAYESKNIEIINKAKLIFFTGGDQLRITSLMGGTPIFEKLKEKLNDGTYIVGTSAGASVMSNTMILEGRDEEAPKKSSIEMSPGFGFIKGVIIDQHFDQRGRIGRLLSIIAQNPEILGIGIDENTAIIANYKDEIQVIGEGAVYFVDGRNITYTDVCDQNANKVLSIFDVKLHVLKNRDKFSIFNKAPIKEENSEK